MFISIINDSFASVRKNSEKQNDDLNMVQFVNEKLKEFTNFYKSETKFNQNVSINNKSVIYKDQLDFLPEKFDQLLFSLSEVNQKFFL
jgi:heterodisulfide reductase subunit B